jgi:hypothetical protein
MGKGLLWAGNGEPDLVAPHCIRLAPEGWVYAAFASTFTVLATWLSLESAAFSSSRV